MRGRTGVRAVQIGDQEGGSKGQEAEGVGREGKRGWGAERTGDRNVETEGRSREIEWEEGRGEREEEGRKEKRGREVHGVRGRRRTIESSCERGRGGEGRFQE